MWLHSGEKKIEESESYLKEVLIYKRCYIRTLEWSEKISFPWHSTR